LVGYVIEESVSVNCELVDDLADEGLDLQEGIDTASNLLVYQILEKACYLLHG
jgi:hypothetical protein